MAINFKPMDEVNASDLEAHSLAELFPMMDGAAFDDLKADIRKHGLREPIQLFESRVLDGRNRLKACRELGVQPIFKHYDGPDAQAFVISLNLQRRHLTESQRAMVAAKLANDKRGGDRRSDQSANLRNVSQTEAAEKLNVSRRAVQSAKKVQTVGVPELSKAVDEDQIVVSVAAAIAEQPEDIQRKIIEENKRKRKRLSKEDADATIAHFNSPNADEHGRTVTQIVRVGVFQRALEGAISTLDGAPDEEVNPWLTEEEREEALQKLDRLSALQSQMQERLAI